MTWPKCSWLSQNLKKYCLSNKKTKENQFNHNIKSKRNTSLPKNVTKYDSSHGKYLQSVVQNNIIV